MLVELVGYMKLFSKGLFSFLSILIGYNAQKAFGGSGVNGAIWPPCFRWAMTPSHQRHLLRHHRFLRPPH